MPYLEQGEQARRSREIYKLLYIKILTLSLKQEYEQRDLNS